MSSVSELDNAVEDIFSAQLVAQGFTACGQRRWFRNAKGRVADFCESEGLSLDDPVLRGCIAGAIEDGQAINAKRRAGSHVDGD